MPMLDLVVFLLRTSIPIDLMALRADKYPSRKLSQRKCWPKFAESCKGTVYLIQEDACTDIPLISSLAVLIIRSTYKAPRPTCCTLFR